MLRIVLMCLCTYENTYLVEVCARRMLAATHSLSLEYILFKWSSYLLLASIATRCDSTHIHEWQQGGLLTMRRRLMFACMQRAVVLICFHSALQSYDFGVCISIIYYVETFFFESFSGWEIISHCRCYVLVFRE